MDYVFDSNLNKMRSDEVLGNEQAAARRLRFAFICLIMMLAKHQLESTKFYTEDSKRQTMFRALSVKTRTDSFVDVQSELEGQFTDFDRYAVKYKSLKINSFTHLMPCIIFVRVLLLRALRELLEETAKNAEPSWITLVPLFHCLTKEIQPLKKIPVETEHKEDKWWGVEKMGGAKFTFQSKLMNSPKRYFFVPFPIIVM